MSLKIDRVQLEIIIKNDQSRADLRKLEDQSRLLSKELRKLPEGTDEWIKKTAELKTVKQRIDEVYNKIGLTGLSLKELSSRQKELNAIMRNMDPRTKEYQNLQAQLKGVNARMGELKNGAKQAESTFSKVSSAFRNMLPVIGVTAAIGSLVKFGKAVISSSDALSDKYEKAMGAAKTATQLFLKSFATGDFDNFFQRLVNAAKAGRDYAEALDQIGDRTRSLTMAEAEANVEKQKLLKILKDVTKSDTDRIAAADKIINMENRLMDTRSSIAKQSWDAKILNLEALGITEDMILANLKNYEVNQDLIKQADEYNEKLKTKNGLEEIYNKNSTLFTTAEKESFQSLKLEIDNTSRSVKDFAEMRQKYGAISEEEMDQLVKLWVDYQNALASADENTQKTYARRQSLIEGIMKIEKKANDETIKKSDDTAKKYDELYTKLGKLHDDWLVSKMSKDNQEIQAVNDKYFQLIEAAKGNKDLVQSLELQRDAELNDLKDAQQAKHREEEEKALKEFEDKKAAYLKEYQQLTLDELEQKEIESLQQKFNDTIASQQALYEQGLIDKETYDANISLLHDAFEQGYQEIVDYYNNLELQKQIEFENARNNILQQFGLLPRKSLIEQEFNELKKAREKDLINSKEYETATFNLKLKAAKEWAAEKQANADIIYKVVTTARDSELAYMDASYENEYARLNNQLKNKQISQAQYEAFVTQQKEKQEADRKEIMKKYADIEMVAKIAQIGAATVTGAIEAFKAMAGIPVVGPILGGIAAAAVVTYGGVQMATAKQERDRIKQLAKGKYDVIGEDDGRLYKNVPYVGKINKSGYFSKPTLISERGGETVLTAAHTNNIRMNYPWLTEAIKATRVPQHAEGSYPVATPAIPVQNNQVLENLNQGVVLLAAVTNRLNSKLDNLYAKFDYEYFKEETGLIESIEDNMAL